MRKDRNCPACNRVLRATNWGAEEYIKQCKFCGYLDHWYFGQQDLAIGNWKRSFVNHCYTSEENQKLAEKLNMKWTKKVQKAKKYFKRVGQFDIKEG